MKILIISHNPISTYQSMGKTLLSLFSSFTKKDLCQIYIYPTTPDIDICNSYFRITDRDILNSYFNFGKVKSRKISSNDIGASKTVFFESKEDEKLLKRKKTYFNLMVRDVAWRCSLWFNRALKSWLEEEKPDRIFLAPGEAIFIYDIALLIHKTLKIPIVTYMCDEFYFLNSPKSILGNIHSYFLRKKIEELMRQCNGIITICDELTTAYKTKFAVPAETVYTGAAFDINQHADRLGSPTGITYLGNMSCGRLKSIIDVGNVLSEINAETDSHFNLFLYTRFLSNEQKKQISHIPTIKYCGYVVKEDYKKVLFGADLLLHVESFDTLYVDKVKHSISTKIADSLASGVPLIAYGNGSVASMKYLIGENCAFCAVNKAELKKILVTALFQGDARQAVVERSISVANKNHCAKKNSAFLKKKLAEYTG